MTWLLDGMTRNASFILGAIFGFVLCMYPLWALLDRAGRAEWRLRHYVCACCAQAHHGGDAA